MCLVKLKTMINYMFLQSRVWWFVYLFRKLAKHKTVNQWNKQKKMYIGVFDLSVNRVIFALFCIFYQRGKNHTNLSAIYFRGPFSETFIMFSRHACTLKLSMINVWYLHLTRYQSEVSIYTKNWIKLLWVCKNVTI